MHYLELKVPPVVVLMISAFSIWWVAPSGVEAPTWRWLLLAISLVVGVAVALRGALVFRGAGTTLSPMHPEHCSDLVRHDIFHYTRNPMYLGMLICLCGAAVVSMSVWSLLSVTGFVLYMNRFQITPEERMLEQLFPQAYPEYKNTVQRWLSIRNIL